MSFLHNCDPICINVIFASIWYLACNLLFNLDSELSLNYDFTLILQFKCAGCRQLLLQLCKLKMPFVAFSSYI
jgi:hypothetical protein